MNRIPPASSVIDAHISAFSIKNSAMISSSSLRGPYTKRADAKRIIPVFSSFSRNLLNRNNCITAMEIIMSVIASPISIIVASGSSARAGVIANAAISKIVIIIFLFIFLDILLSLALQS